MRRSKNKTLLIVALTLISATNISCKKENKCVGGSGGSLSVKATLMHHTKYIYSMQNYRDTVYVKYNALDAPQVGLSGYDTKFIGDVGNDYVMITGLKCGDYYLLAFGGDTSWSPGVLTRVVGGYPLTTSQTSGELDINMAVTEH